LLLSTLFFQPALYGIDLPRLACVRCHSLAAWQQWRQSLQPAKLKDDCVSRCLAGGVLGAMICKLWLYGVGPGCSPPDRPPGVGAFSQLGDLVESLLKRNKRHTPACLYPRACGLLDQSLDSLLSASHIGYARGCLHEKTSHPRPHWLPLQYPGIKLQNILTAL
jgi:hypothetical protein